LTLDGGEQSGLHPSSFISVEEALGTPHLRGWVGCRASRESVVKRKSKCYKEAFYKVYS